MTEGDVLSSTTMLPSRRAGDNGERPWRRGSRTRNCVFTTCQNEVGCWATCVRVLCQMRLLYRRAHFGLVHLPNGSCFIGCRLFARFNWSIASLDRRVKPTRPTASKDLVTDDIPAF
jgi:hypothetical protein